MLLRHLRPEASVSMKALGNGFIKLIKAVVAPIGAMAFVFKGDTKPASATGTRHRIVIVGGGAGGLELATRLGNSLGRRGRADITLIDKYRTHIWKPKLHEIASGSMDMSAHEVD
jgi:hypothetical protein